MARIRTIKPEFFTSEDIVQLSPFARLLYISLWCEADREGRMQWRQRTFKMRYFPSDSIDIDALCNELINAGLVVQYGDGYAYIPKFSAHQHINPRETASSIPAPDDCEASRVTHASARVQAQSVTHREEGKGKEGIEDASASLPPHDAKRATRISADWKLPDEWKAWAVEHQPTWTDRYALTVADTFRDYWIAKSGKDGAKLDWEATWRNWVRRQGAMPASAKAANDWRNDPIFAGMG